MTERTSSQSPVAMGSLIADKYRVERVLGKGGMGIVVAARHIKLNESVAIKIMFGDDLSHKAAVERFLREARACVKLKNNEHVARVTDVDTLPNGLPYMVMELLDGQDLDKRLKDGGVFPIHEACSYIVQACRALSEAHKLGIIHRDIKPQNLFLTQRHDRSPCIKVLDFGISKHTLADESESIDLTRPCDILGSAYYMAPEQARSSRTVVPQSDIYSLGAVLYKLLTGRAPFPKKTLLEVYEALLTETPPPPSQFRTSIPRPLDVIILRCLDKTVETRFSSAHELMAALAPFTVPGETALADDSDNVTTLPRVHSNNKGLGLHGTMPLDAFLARKSPNPAQPPGPGNHAPNAANPLLNTLPVDQRTLYAALHEYLPPRPNGRPPTPPPRSAPHTAKDSGNEPTPRMIPPMVAKPAPVREEPPPRSAIPSSTSTPLPGVQTPIPPSTSVPSVQGKGTVYAPHLAHLTAPSNNAPERPGPVEHVDASMTSWNTFPHSITKAKKPIGMILAGSAIAIVIVWIAVEFLS